MVTRMSLPQSPIIMGNKDFYNIVTFGGSKHVRLEQEDN